MGVTVTASTDSAASGPANVKMTPAAVEELAHLAPPQAESVARAIAAIGQVEGKPVEAAGEAGEAGAKYLAMVPDDKGAPVVMYRAADDNGYLVTTLVDRATYKTYEKAERVPSFLASTTFRTAAGAVAAAAVGAILGSRGGGRSSS
jgi:hypothetical protein